MHCFNFGKKCIGFLFSATWTGFKDSLKFIIIPKTFDLPILFTKLGNFLVKHNLNSCFWVDSGIVTVQMSVLRLIFRRDFSSVLSESLSSWLVLVEKPRFPGNAECRFPSFFSALSVI